MLVAIIPDGMTGTTLDTFLAHRDLLRYRRLIEHVNHIALIIAVENGRRDLTTDRAIKTEHIDIEFTGNIFSMAVSEFSHKRSAIPFGFANVLERAGFSVA